MDTLFDWLMGLAVALIVILVGFMLWDTVTADTFTLRKDEWKCTEYRDITTFILAGKVLVPTVNRQCQAWERVR
jgi:hypothetical protein